SDSAQTIIDNIELLHECKENRDAHLLQILEQGESEGDIDLNFAPQRKLRANDEGVHESVRPSDSKVEREWQDVEYVFIDEMSMVGLNLLARLAATITIGKSAPAELPFGGVNLVLFGDYIQYSPVMDKALYTNLENELTTKA
ncbi:unnamed protein product, partial [Didymodactylos carnosus]